MPKAESRINRNMEKPRGWIASSLTLAAWLPPAFLLGVGLAMAEDAKAILTRLDKHPPYGTYTPQPGSWYGHRRAEIDGGEARRILIRFYESRGLRVGDITEHPDFFQTDVYRGNLSVDRVILHKTTGRIRSVY